MKTFFITLLLIALCNVNSYSQDTIKNSFGRTKKYGISLETGNPCKDDIHLGWYNSDIESVNGFNLKDHSIGYGLSALYNFNSQTTLRLGCSLSNIHMTEYMKHYDGGSYLDYSYVAKQKIVEILPSIIWKLPFKKLELYGGFTGIIGFHGVFTINSSFSNADSTTGVIQNKTLQTQTLPKGNSYGIGGLFGFEYMLNRWLSIGGEFSPSLSYARLSGKTERVSYSVVPSAPTTVYNTQDENKGFVFYDTHFSIGLSLWF